MLSPATRPMSLPERLGLYLFAALVLAFGILVELRSAGLSRRMGDLDVYLRAAWAARVGADMYAVASDNDWHYIYPPFYALLLMPLADPPGGAPSAGYVPYPVSVALFFACNAALLCCSAHVLAAALERISLRPQPRCCRRWWALRSWPIVACLPPVAQTLMRGQVNHLVLALLCLCLACLLRGRRLQAGLLLAGAVCIKVIPIFLLVYPAWKRDGRMLAGCGLGLLAGLLVIPTAILGPERTLHQYKRYGEVFFGPFLGLSDDDSRRLEVLGMNSTDSVGLRNAIFNWSHLDSADRPAEFTPAAVWSYRCLGALMTLVVLWPAGVGAWHEAARFSALILLMAILSPVCHLHYLVFCLPLVACLLARRFAQQDTLALPAALWALLAIFVASNVVPSLPGLGRLKDLCVNLLGTLPLWCAGIMALWSRRSALEQEPRRSEPVLMQTACARYNAVTCTSLSRHAKSQP
jgi:alpha-1,2-mannosyltransferase